MVYTAVWNNQIVAQAENDKCKIVEGNVYFPANTIKKEFFKGNDEHTVCSWKGTASYYDVVVDGKTNHSAAWYYPEASDAAKDITGFIAFWRGVEVSEE